MIDNHLIVEHVNFGTDDLEEKYDTYKEILEKVHIEMDFTDRAIVNKVFNLYPDHYFKNKDVYKDVIIDKIKQKAIGYFLKNENEYIGVCLALNSNNFYIDTYLINIFLIFSKFRSQGYGKYLLKYSLNDLKTRYKIKHFGINCYNNNNAAMKLYRSFGFSPVSTFMMKL